MMVDVKRYRWVDKSPYMKEWRGFIISIPEERMQSDDVIVIKASSQASIVVKWRDVDGRFVDNIVVVE